VRGFYREKQRVLLMMGGEICSCSEMDGKKMVLIERWTAREGTM